MTPRPQHTVDVWKEESATQGAANPGGRVREASSETVPCGLSLETKGLSR